ncbi:M50 family metallopeptidase [Paenibacillus sp. HB172176]|uniref:M50 family metallopeptidase n=1 Tax=Paenibacillus sp. HB172176 TaxID=2493690 RepID=UPI001439817A|nr:M50 family metallopeptidase [Paenibacillus sp. HB172176]
MIKWRGIAWSVHPLFIMVMLASLLTGYFPELLTLFVIVVVHELGHVLAARAFRWKVLEVKLLPFGGVAEVEDAGGISAKEEAIVAIAGPLQNGWMALAAWGCGAGGLWDAAWAEYIIEANVMLALFNLLPIYPLDGGKLLQALLSILLNYYRTLVWTARLSLLFSAAMLATAIVPLFLQAHGLQLNVLIVASFLFMTNWTYRRHIPYLFYRFLMHRERSAELVIDRGKGVTPLIVSGKQSILSVARMFKREKVYLVYMLEHARQELRMLPEQRIVEGCLSGSNPNRAVHELFS